MTILPGGVTETEWGMDCIHTHTALRYRIVSNGVAHWVYQCLVCGAALRNVSKNSSDVLAMTDRPPFDNDLADEWNTRIRQHQEQKKTNDDQEWQEWYITYLASSEWRVKRQAVMRRAQGVCEGCLAAQATEVHHLTYAHAGNEFLFELVAVCHTCHTRLHKEKGQ